MSIGNNPEQRQKFIAQFQELTGWSSLNTEVQSSLQVLFDTMADDSFPGAILPRLINGNPVYYAMAETGRDWRSLAPLLKAFVGVTVTDFIGLTSAMNTADPLEAWLSSFGFEAIARFGPGSDPRNQKLAEASLLCLFECLNLTEARQKSQPRSTRQVLDDFRLALAARDPLTAREHIAFLRANIRLDAMNLCFLEVQLEATFGNWEQLQQQPFFRELCYTRRPPSITAAMVETVYHTKIEPIELANGPVAALEVFRSQVHGQYADLFKVCPPAPQPPVAKMFLLTAMTGEDIDYQAIDTLVMAKTNWSEDKVTSFDQFLALVEPPRSTIEVTIKSSWANLRHGLELAEDKSEPATIERAKAVLWSAVELQSLDAYRTAINYINRLSSAERETLFAIPGYAGIWFNISQYATEERVPHNWCEWLELLPQMSYSQAQAYAERSVDEWPIDQHLQYPKDVQELVDALGSVDLAQENRVFTALPNLLLWVQSDRLWPNPDYYPLYEQLLTLFMLADTRNLNTLQALMNLLEGILTLGLNEQDYNQLMNDLGDLVQQLGGTRYIDWLIDVAELTTLYACPNPTARLNLLTQIIAIIDHLAVKLTRSQLSVLNDLTRILGISEQIATLAKKEAGTGLSDLNELIRGYSVTIYTLTESVGQRVARMLTAQYPGIKVDLSHDKASTPRLVDLARNADLFVICWRSAKHAATDAIRQKRPAHRPTIYASGKGSSSILAAIEEHLSGTFVGAQNV